MTRRRIIAAGVAATIAYGALFGLGQHRGALQGEPGPTATPRPTAIGCAWSEQPSRRDCPPGVPNGATILTETATEYIYLEPRR